MYLETVDWATLIPTSPSAWSLACERGPDRTMSRNLVDYGFDDLLRQESPSQLPAGLLPGRSLLRSPRFAAQAHLCGDIFVVSSDGPDVAIGVF